MTDENENVPEQLPDEDEQARLRAVYDRLFGNRIPSLDDQPLQDADANEALLNETPPVRKPSVREKVLKTANKLVNGDRNQSYGDPTADFARTAQYWQTHLIGVAERNEGRLVITAQDVAIMMSLLKISRLAWSPAKADNWVDLAGYAACGAECAEKQEGLTW